MKIKTDKKSLSLRDVLKSQALVLKDKENNFYLGFYILNINKRFQINSLFEINPRYFGEGFAVKILDKTFFCKEIK